MIKTLQCSAKPLICIVDDEVEVCNSLCELFESEGIHCIATSDPEEAGGWLLSRTDLRLLITDVRMPGSNGLELVRAASRTRPDLAVIVMTGYASVENAVTAMRLGAVNFVSKSVDFPAMLREVRQILGSQSESGGDDQEIITEDPHFLAPLRQLDLAAATDAPVVLLGESGTGKELLARRLHCLSPRRDHAYLCVNCAALPDALLESELFGHEKGAFTGAAGARKGRFKLADRGTIFLDEIGDMPQVIQAKILRAIEHGEFERLGGETVFRSDIRFVAATNKNLQKLMEAGKFRTDLYCRLSVVALNLPPLRERPGDIPLLVRHFIDKFNRAYGKSLAGVSDEVADLLVAHDWPGDVRELRNCIQRAAIFRSEGVVVRADLPEQYQNPSLSSAVPGVSDSRRDRLRKVDKELIARTLAECDGRKSLAADKLRIHRKTLYNRMKALGLGD